MQEWISLGRGPLFRLAFSLMVLGSLRLVLVQLLGAAEAYRRNPDRIVAWREVIRQTFAWMVPLGRLWEQRPVYSTISFLFHVGLIGTPLLLAAHILLWQRSVGLSWPAMPQVWADRLTLLTIGTGLALLLIRLLDAPTRALSGPQDYGWLVLLVTPSVTGYVCANAPVGPKTYHLMMLIHVYAGDLIMALIPFSKIAHCALAPLSQTVSALAWKFVPGAGDKIIATLGRAGMPSYVATGRAQTAAGTVAVTGEEFCSR